MAHGKVPQNFDEHLQFQRREWLVQRIGWAFIAGLLVLALAGLFGNGPLSHARAASKEGGSIEYERYVRSGSLTKLVMTPAAKAARGASKIEITAKYLQGFRVEQVTPEPSAVLMHGDRFIYEFAATVPDASITFNLEPESLGRHTAEVAIDGGAPLTIRQYTYP
jgi:hypothetical protein